MPSIQKIHEFFGLRDTKSGELVRIDFSDHAQLTLDPACPLYECTSQERLGLALMQSTPSYNACAETPDWGRLHREQLQPVKVRTALEVEDLEFRAPLQVKTAELRAIPYQIARRYAGEELPALAQSEVVFWLVELPAGLSVADACAYEGEVVYAGDRWSGRKLFKALPVPADYADVLEGKNGALFLASSLWVHLDS